MIISPARGYIFVHIPKTGGTSLALALEAHALPGDILIGDTPEAKRRRRQQAHLRGRGRLWKHSTLADIDGLLPTETLARLRCVTLVRNPWDRAVSYYHWLRGQSFGHPAVARAQALDFAAFLRHPATQAGFRAWPSARYVTDASGRERPTLFLRLEHLEADLAPFARRLGVALQLPHANRSPRGDYRGYYDAALVDTVAACCAADIGRFGYRFDG